MERLRLMTICLILLANFVCKFELLERQTFIKKKYRSENRIKSKTQQTYAER